MIKFLHAADLHLDSPFHGLTPRQAVLRRQEHRALLEELVSLANKEACDLLLLAGDLFDSDNAYPETLEALCKALGDFRGSVFIAPGNHDCLYPGSPYFSANFPENVHIFTKKDMTSVTLPHLNCTVWGAGFASPAMPALLEGFRVADKESLNLMVLHGDAEKQQSDYNPITKEQIAASGLDYLALGHVHLRAEPAKAGKTVYTWPGCPMGRGFDETGEKGVYLGEVDENGCFLRFVPMSGRRYEILTVEVGNDPLTDVLRALPESTENHIYRIRLVGQCDPIDAAALYRELESRFYALSIRDKTERRHDLWQNAGEDGLKGQFLSALQEKLTTATEEEKALITMAAELGVRAMEGREEEVVL